MFEVEVDGVQSSDRVGWLVPLICFGCAGNKSRLAQTPSSASRPRQDEPSPPTVAEPSSVVGLKICGVYVGSGLPAGSKAEVDSWLGGRDEGSVPWL